MRGACGQRPGQPRRHLAQRHPRGFEQARRIGPALHYCFQPLARSPCLQRQAGAQPPPAIVEQRHQFGAHRHRHFRRRGRGRRAAVGGEVDQRGVGLMPHRRNQRDRRFGGGAHHNLLIERPQILDRTATTRDDDQIGSRDQPPVLKRAEAADRRRHRLRRRFALDRHRPHQHMRRAAVGQPVEDIADHRPGRRGDDADGARQERQRALAGLVEQSFGGEHATALVEQRHQRALPGQLDPLDHQLIFGPPGIGGELARGDHFGAILGRELQSPRLAPPQHRVDIRRLVLQREITMARSVALPPRNLAAHADMAERLLDRALQRPRQFADREGWRIVASAVLG